MKTKIEIVYIYLVNKKENFVLILCLCTSIWSIGFSWNGCAAVCMHIHSSKCRYNRATVVVVAMMPHKIFSNQTITYDC